jgi:hypothetical protein
MGTYRYIDVLPDFVAAYNRTPHSSIGGMRPIDVNTNNFKKAWQHLYGTEWPGFQGVNRLPPKFRYNVGDQVRVSHLKGPFDKGYLPNWSEDIFTIVKQIGWTPVGYKIIRNGTKEVLDGVFYEPELLPAPTLQQQQK